MIVGKVHHDNRVQAITQLLWEVFNTGMLKDFFLNILSILVGLSILDSRTLLIETENQFTCAMKKNVCLSEFICSKCPQICRSQFSDFLG